MNPRFLVSVCGALLIAGVFLAVGWDYGDAQPPGDAWTLDRTEQILSGISPGQEVKAAFHLTNTSHHPLRILGNSAC